MQLQTSKLLRNRTEKQENQFQGNRKKNKKKIKGCGHG